MLLIKADKKNMTKKDYQLIAEIIKKVGSLADGNGIGEDAYINSNDGNGIKSGIEEVLIPIIEKLKKDNPRFDSSKFEKAIFQK